MTKKELVECLDAFPNEARVLITWEGLVVEIGPDNIYQAKSGDVLIDADNNYYKEKFQSGDLPTDEIRE